MQRYANLNGNSGVYAFEIGKNYILVQFKGNTQIYRYSYRKAGATHVEAMKLLAQTGKGLSSYITKNARELYD